MSVAQSLASSHGFDTIAITTLSSYGWQNCKIQYVGSKRIHASCRLYKEAAYNDDGDDSKDNIKPIVNISPTKKCLERFVKQSWRMHRYLNESSTSASLSIAIIAAVSLSILNSNLYVALKSIRIAPVSQNEETKSILKMICKAPTNLFRVKTTR